jgi:hypothetical protein
MPYVACSEQYLQTDGFNLELDESDNVAESKRYIYTIDKRPARYMNEKLIACLV